MYEATIPVTAAGDFVQIARFSANAGETWTVVTLPDGTWPPLTVAAPDDTNRAGIPAVGEHPRSVAGGRDRDVGGLAVGGCGGLPCLPHLRGRDADDRGSARRVTTCATTIKPSRRATATVTRSRRWTASLNESEAVPTEEAKVERRRIPVTFIVTVPDYTKEGEGDVYIAGDFGTDDLPFWDPAGIVMTPDRRSALDGHTRDPRREQAAIQVRAWHVGRRRKRRGMRRDRQPHADGRSA